MSCQQDLSKKYHNILEAKPFSDMDRLFLLDLNSEVSTAPPEKVAQVVLWIVRAEEVSWESREEEDLHAPSACIWPPNKEEHVRHLLQRALPPS